MYDIEQKTISKRGFTSSKILLYYFFSSCTCIIEIVIQSETWNPKSFCSLQYSMTFDYLVYNEHILLHQNSKSDAWCVIEHLQIRYYILYYDTIWGGFGCVDKILCNKYIMAEPFEKWGGSGGYFFSCNFLLLFWAIWKNDLFSKSQKVGGAQAPSAPPGASPLPSPNFKFF